MRRDDREADPGDRAAAGDRGPADRRAGARPPVSLVASQVSREDADRLADARSRTGSRA